MEILTGNAFTKLIVTQGTEATMSELKSQYDEIISKDILKYLRQKYCPDPYFCRDEILQLTWGAVFIDIEKFRQGAKSEEYRNPAGWIFRIQRRFCIKDILKHIRVRDQKVFSIEDLNNPDLADERDSIIFPFDNSIESRHYKAEVLKLIRSEILSLPPSQMTAFELFINDFSHKEIAFFLNIKEELSRQWISRIIRKIKIKTDKF